VWCGAVLSPFARALDAHGFGTRCTRGFTAEVSKKKGANKLIANSKNRLRFAAHMFAFPTPRLLAALRPHTRALRRPPSADIISGGLTGLRFNPYEDIAKCKICKSKVHQAHSKYCQQCSYKLGLPAPPAASRGGGHAVGWLRLTCPSLSVSDRYLRYVRCTND
jgi:hypothetical protein